MKDFLKALLVIIAGIIAGAYLHKCQSPQADITGQDECVSDTITVYDTIQYIEPALVSSQHIGFKEITIFPPFHFKSAKRLRASHINQVNKELPDIRADTIKPASADVGATAADSITLQLPVTQNVYEGEDYTAYVSGIYPSLDSMFVYPRREIITIKKPPKRWHIGPTVGFGYTPHGFEPFIGVSVTYSIIDL